MINVNDLLMAVQGVATALAMLALICRAGRMTLATPVAVRAQHAVLFAGLVASVVLPPIWGRSVLALSVLAWLAISAPRWRHGAPVDRPPMIVPAERPSGL